MTRLVDWAPADMAAEAAARTQDLADEQVRDERECAECRAEREAS